ncbi:hypothetical protein [Streptomyces sp. enrichment culture]|uniref:hypothetical protein n=1 Tax=Streptomyces sp. enrichment culture TaxID=1795815 RepID=UPI003F55F578
MATEEEPDGPAEADRLLTWPSMGCAHADTPTSARCGSQCFLGLADAPLLDRFRLPPGPLKQGGEPGAAQALAGDPEHHE